MTLDRGPEAGSPVVDGIAIGRALVWPSDPEGPEVRGNALEERKRLARAIQLATRGVENLIRLLGPAEAELFVPEVAILAELEPLLLARVDGGETAEQAITDATVAGDDGPPARRARAPARRPRSRPPIGGVAPRGTRRGSRARRRVAHAVDRRGAPAPGRGDHRRVGRHRAEPRRVQLARRDPGAGPGHPARLREPADPPHDRGRRRGDPGHDGQRRLGVGGAGRVGRSPRRSGGTTNGRSSAPAKRRRSRAIH